MCSSRSVTVGAETAGQMLQIETNGSRSAQTQRPGAARRVTCRPRLRNGDKLCEQGNYANCKPLVQTTGLRHVLVPVGACLGRALLGFKVNVEEAVTLVVAIGPGELILQAP